MFMTGVLCTVCDAQVYFSAVLQVQNFLEIKVTDTLRQYSSIYPNQYTD